MTLRLGWTVVVAAILLPLSAVADENPAVKCSVNEDRVWVYDSPATLNVEARLQCGQKVQVLSRGNGFVKVQTANGLEGYIPEENAPKAVTAVPEAQPKTGAQPSLASAARATNAARSAPVLAKTPAASAATRATAPAETGAAVHPSKGSAPQPASPSANRPALSSSTTTSATLATPLAPARPAIASTSSIRAKSKHVAKSSSSASTSAPAKPAANSSAPATQRPATSAVLHAAATPSKSTSASSGSSASGAAASPAMPAVNNSMTASASATRGVRNVSDTSAEDEEADDPSYLVQPKSESDDPACRLFFAAYGLSPGQFKWTIDNRKKKFPSVCPAATPSMVDYVIIFTHDAEFFNYTMPEPVHSDGGFSDWNPVVLSDMSAVPRREIDKSKREYVWVFHVKRGTYDPGRFSPHRRYQFTKIESKYARTVEDAFEFIGTRDLTR